MKNGWLNMARIGVAFFMIGGAGMDSESMVIPLVLVGIGLVLVGMGVKLDGIQRD